MTNTAKAQTRQQFAMLMSLEDGIRHEKAMAAMGSTMDIRWNAQQRLARLQREMSEAIDALTPEQGEAYGTYRLTER